MLSEKGIEGKHQKQNQIDKHNAGAGGQGKHKGKEQAENKAKHRDKRCADDNAAKAVENAHGRHGGEDDEAGNQKRAHDTHADDDGNGG